MCEGECECERKEKRPDSRHFRACVPVCKDINKSDFYLFTDRCGINGSI